MLLTRLEVRVRAQIHGRARDIELGRCMSYDYVRNTRIKRKGKRNCVTGPRYRSRK